MTKAAEIPVYTSSISHRNVNNSAEEYSTETDITYKESEILELWYPITYKYTYEKANNKNVEFNYCFKVITFLFSMILHLI